MAKNLPLPNGPEFIATALADWVQPHNVELEFIEPSRPTQNGFIEQFNRSYRESLVPGVGMTVCYDVSELNPPPLVVGLLGFL